MKEKCDVRIPSESLLTRGDLWQHWEGGVKVFDLYLLDSDWALNNANWQWLSCSNFFYQYFRVYSPIAFGKKTDPHGDYIRKWVPQLKHFPDKFIYEPWKAPLAIQRECLCIIGKDYPSPIIDHEIASQQNMQRMKAAYTKYKEVDEMQEEDNDVKFQNATHKKKRKTMEEFIQRKKSKN